MRSIRQLGGGVIVAIFSVILVIGGIFLSLAETLPPAATPTQIPPTLPLNFPTPTPTPSLLTTTPTETATPTTTASPSPTPLVLAPTSCTPPSGWIRILMGASDTVYSLAQRYKTSAESLGAANCLQSFDLPAGYAMFVPPVPTVTVVPCGAPAGWVRTHVVQAGDNLYRIALSYGLTYPQLQRANCMGGSTTIYAGQRLWVPNVPTRTPVPGVTIIPDFPTTTSTASPVPTDTIIPTATATDLPTATFTPSPTATPTVTDPPTQAPQ